MLQENFILFIEKSTNKCKASWDLIKNTSQNKPYIKEIDQSRVNNSVHTNAQTICELFNDFFINKAKTGNKNDKFTNTSKFHVLPNSNKSMFLKRSI